MPQPLDPAVQEQFLSLPKAVQDVITESNWQFTIRDIIKKFNLRIDQGGVIENEVFLVMLGFQDADDFLENIIREGNMDRGIAGALEKEVGAVIFAPLRKALMQKIDENAEAVKMIQTIKTSQPLESREDLLKQIEDPSEIPEIAPIVTTRQNIATPIAPTQTIPEPITAPNPAPTAPKIDPYREPIE